MDPSLADEMEFSFSCDKCSFTTKGITEIKEHILSHKTRCKDPGETAAIVRPQDDQEKDPTKTHHTQSQSTAPTINALHPVTDRPTEEATPTGDVTMTSASPYQPGAATPSTPTPRTEVRVHQAASTERKTDERKESEPQKPGGGSSVIVSQEEKPMNIHEGRAGIQSTKTAGEAAEVPGSIADRIHSRRRPASKKKPQEDFQEKEEEEFVPYRRPAKCTPSRMKRGRGRGRGRGASAHTSVRVSTVKAGQSVASDRFKCQHCHFVCKFEQNLQAHLRGAHPEAYAKTNCEAKQEEEGGEAPKTEESASPDRYQCTLCQGFSCRFKKDLYDHKTRAHGVASPTYKYQSRIPDDRYQCPECDYVCKFQRSLRLHYRTAHPRSVKTPDAIREKKEKVAADRYQCPDCDFACKFKGLLKNHRARLHKKERPAKAVREQQCEFCHKFIQGTMHHYRRHLKTHSGEKPYKCDVCDAVFGDQSRLNAHAPIHQEERNYLCDQCGKCFKRAINLRMHRKVHLVVRPHGCELCSYRCKRHDTLNLHMKRKHLKIRRILCHTCGKKFFSEKECQLHVARKHLPRPTPFQCTFCPLAFPFAYNLRAHMRKHPEHKPFRCDFCTFESRSKASLHDHQKMHTGEKQKKCELCDYTTSTSSNLYKHRKRQHGVVMNRAKSRGNEAERHTASLTQPLVIHGTPVQGALSATPLGTAPTVAMLPTPDNHQPPRTMHLHGCMQTSPQPLAPPISQIQPAPSPSLASACSIAQSVSMATPNHVDLHNVQAFEDFKDRRAIVYNREKSLIGSVITEALAEARNVQSELFSGHMIPSTMSTAGLHPSGLPVATTAMAPPHGGIVPGEAVIHNTVPTSTGMPTAPPGMFSSIMNIPYQ